MAETIRWASTQQDEFLLHLARTDRGLCYVGSPGEGLEELQQQCLKRFLDAEFVHDPEALADYLEFLDASFAGTNTAISLPLDTAGTEFQRATWQALREIPYGGTISYSALAEKIGKQQAVRAVASAVGANPLLIFVPCHRVIRKNGDVTGFRGGMALKHRLLELERR